MRVFNLFGSYARYAAFCSLLYCRGKNLEPPPAWMICSLVPQTYHATGTGIEQWVVLVVPAKAEQRN